MKKKFLTEDLERDFNYYIDTNCDFDLSLGRFSAEIRIDGQRLFYSKDKKRSVKLFHILKKLKAELLPKLHEFPAPKASLNYFFINYKQNYGLLNFTEKKVCNIDIKSAYLTALIKKGVLSSSLCEKLINLPKEDRLVIIGMLAFQPTVYHYENGNLFGFTKKENPFRNVFFYCVSEIERIMKAIFITSEDFIIGTWVDGIYFIHDAALENDIKNYLTFHGYEYTVDFLSEFELLEDEFEVSLNFKNGKGKDKKITYPSKNRAISKINSDIRDKIYGKRPISEKEFDTFLDKN